MTKTYGSINAIDQLNLRIHKGEFFGLLGPNGAGKTTLIRMLSTLTPSTLGSISIDGVLMDRDKSRVKSKIGIVSQHTNLESELTAKQNLELHGKLFRMPKDVLTKRIDESLEFTNLSNRKNDIIRHFSGGMKRKLMIARALLHSPEVLLMDEPTIGLDVTARRKLWDLMKRLNKEGMTVILTTHYVEEAEALCSRVGFLNFGKIIALDTPTNLIRASGEFALECFDERVNETKNMFFSDRETALEKAKSLSTSVNIRPTNLEDTFVLLTNRKVGENHECFNHSLA
nr:ABC transporter ATP-binding protein [Alkalibacter mobilis]